MKMRKVLLLVLVTAAVVLSPPMARDADAAGRGSRSGASVSINQSHEKCLNFLANCWGQCVNIPPGDDYDICVNTCWQIKQVCNKIADWWSPEDRNAAHGVVGQGGIKDPSAAGKLKASALGTRTGTATARMPGAVSRANSIATTNSGVISTKGGAVTNSGVGRRGTVAGHPVTGAAGATFRPQ